jgi:hypothetical protein
LSRRTRGDTTLAADRWRRHDTGEGLFIWVQAVPVDDRHDALNQRLETAQMREIVTPMG